MPFFFLFSICLLHQHRKMLYDMKMLPAFYHSVDMCSFFLLSLSPYRKHVDIHKHADSDNVAVFKLDF